ncbi:MAG: FAD-dependent oxidoreductase [Myxococcales bacterium]|nr:FAD-dependent oxidoreductase [Myxococcales bacterium]
MARICIFGAGPGGLYTAWRLVEGGGARRGDVIELYDWGNYQFETGGTREPAGRICTYHHNGDSTQSYIEVGGMRFLQWDPKTQSGHRLVSEVVEQLKLPSVAFDTTDDPLFYLREKNFYSSDIGPLSPAPYNAQQALAGAAPDQVFTTVATDAIDPAHPPKTRTEQCAFYGSARLPASYRSHVFKPGQRLRDIGYWNLMYDAVGNEAYRYADMGGGYSSNVINWHSADALIYNSEFAPGGQFKTLPHGYSELFRALFQRIVQWAPHRGVTFNYHPQERLHSIRAPGGKIVFRTATAANPDLGGPEQTADHAVLAMPPRALALVAQATQYLGAPGDILNAPQVTLYRESVILQPSYKVAMFFDSPWWTTARFAPRLGTASTFGPTITDTPLRQVYYFGNNGTTEQSPVHGLLASYDDESFVKFWHEMELGPFVDRKVAPSRDLQPMVGPRQCPPAMVTMLREQLALVHFGTGAALSNVPRPVETVYMDWGQNPFGAGYHAWAAHYDICDVMQRIRRPSSLTDGPAANIYVVGSAYSNDQAWVEGAFCTAESVLDDFFGMTPIVDDPAYPFICGCAPEEGA